MTRIKIFSIKADASPTLRVRGPAYTFGEGGQGIIMTRTLDTAYAPLFKVKGKGQSIGQAVEDARQKVQQRAQVLWDTWVAQEGSEPGTIYVLSGPVNLTGVLGARVAKHRIALLAVATGWVEGPPTIPERWWYERDWYEWDEDRGVGRVKIDELKVWEDLTLPPT